jgi:hypothetical protein
MAQVSKTENADFLISISPPPSQVLVLATAGRARPCQGLSHHNFCRR